MNYIESVSSFIEILELGNVHTLTTPNRHQTYERPQILVESYTRIWHDQRCSTVQHIK